MKTITVFYKMKLITVLVLHLICFFHLVCLELDVNNVFVKFQKTYGRQYPNTAALHKAFENFKKNLNKVMKLNGRENDFEKIGVHHYHLNRYADQDPKEVYDRYGISMKPYYYSEDEKEYLRQNKKNMQQLPLENMNLYNLDDTLNIYENFKNQFNKENEPDEFQRTLKYQRFYQTLVEFNNLRFNGDDQVLLEKDADIIKNSQEIFFDMD